MSSEFDSYWQTLEQAVAAYSQDPHAKAATDAFKQFRQLPNIVPVAQYILQRSTITLTRFQCLRALAEAVVNHWDSLSLQEVMGILSFIVQFIQNELSRPPAPTTPSVIQQAILVVVVIVKRGWLDPNTLKDTPSSAELKKALISQLQTFNQSDNILLKAAGMQLVRTLVEEFGSSSRTVKINMPWEYHVEVFSSFESTFLFDLFQMALLTMHPILQRIDQLILDQKVKNLFKETLSVLSQCLQWPFGQGRVAILGFGFTKRGTKFVQLPPQWRPIVTESSDLLEMFFRIFKHVKSDNDSCKNFAIDGLLQLASLANDSFAHGMPQIVQYNSFFSQKLRPIITASLTGEEIYSTTQIITRFVENIPLGPMASAAGDEFAQFCEAFYQMSLRTLQLYSRDVENATKAVDSFDLILDAWTALIATDEAPQYAIEGAVKLFNVYMEARLTRAREEVQDDEDATDDDGYPLIDREYYSDQLIQIAKLGRCASLNAITLVGQHLSRCMELLQRWSQADESVQIDETWEEIHWLVIIGCYLLTDDPRGETPSLAPELVMPNNRLDEHIAQGGTDPLVQLSQSFFTLIEWMNQTVMQTEQSGQKEHSWSSTVAEDLMWFLSRWASFYLLVVQGTTEFSVPVRQSILDRFGMQSPNGPSLLDFVVRSAWINLVGWSGAYSEVQYEACEVLAAVARRRFPPNILASCSAWNTIVDTHCRDGPVLFAMKSHVQRKFIRCLCEVQLGDDDTQRASYLQAILQPLENRWSQLVQNPELRAKPSGFVRDVTRLLDRCRGAVLACSGTTWRPIFSFTKRLFNVWVDMLRIYQIFSDTKLTALKLICDATDKLLDWIADDVEVEHYLDGVMHFMKVFDDLKMGRLRPPRNSKRKTTQEQSDEYEKKREIEELLKILGVVSSQRHMKAAHATSFGLHVALPLLTPTMLDYKEIRTGYFEVVANLFNRHTARLPLLPDPLFKMILDSFEFGLTLSEEKIERLTLEGIGKLAEFIFAPPPGSPPLSPEKRAMVPPLVKHILSYLLFEDGFNFDMVDLASTTFLAVICAEQAAYMQMVNTLIAEQSPAIQPRLIAYFQALMQDIDLSLAEENKRKYREKMRAFLGAARGILGSK